MASGPGTGVAAPPAEHIAKGTASDPALQAAVSRALATNDQASLLAMQPTIQSALAGAAQQYAVTPQGTLAAIPAAIQQALPAIQQALAPATAALPQPAQQALMQLGQQFDSVPMQTHQAQVGRALVNRTTAALDPQLEAIRADLEHRSNQVQATSEHRNIEARKAFQRQVLFRLGMIERAARIPRY